MWFDSLSLNASNKVLKRELAQTAVALLAPHKRQQAEAQRTPACARLGPLPAAVKKPKGQRRRRAARGSAGVSSLPETALNAWLQMQMQMQMQLSSRTT